MKTFTLILLVAALLVGCAPRAHANDTGISNPAIPVFTTDQVAKYVTQLPKDRVYNLAKEVVKQDLRGPELTLLINNTINPNNPVPLDQWSREDWYRLFEFLCRMLESIIGNLPL